VFFCRAANGALFDRPRPALNKTMTLRHDSEPNDWRRRAQQGVRDIAVAVALTVTAVALIGVAWLGNHRPDAGRVDHSAEVMEFR